MQKQATEASRRPVSMVPKRFYRREEAAYTLGVSVRMVDHLITSQKLRTKRIKRCVVIPVEDIDRVEQLIMSDKMLGDDNVS